MKHQTMNIDKEEIIEAARKELPYTEDCKANNCIIPVPRQEVYDRHSSFSDLLNIPFYYEVTFRKQIINDVIVGWEFVSISD